MVNGTPSVQSIISISFFTARTRIGCCNIQGNQQSVSSLQQTKSLSLGQILESQVCFCCCHFEKYDPEVFGIFSKKKKKMRSLYFWIPSHVPPAGTLIYIYQLFWCFHLYLYLFLQLRAKTKYRCMFVYLGAICLPPVLTPLGGPVSANPGLNSANTL